MCFRVYSRKMSNFLKKFQVYHGTAPIGCHMYDCKLGMIGGSILIRGLKNAPGFPWLMGLSRGPMSSLVPYY